MAAEPSQMAIWGDNGMPIKKRPADGKRKPKQGRLDTALTPVILHLRDIETESRVCDALTQAILSQDWDAVMRQAALLPELREVLSVCDPDRDASLGLTLAIYAYRVAASHGQEGTQTKLLRLIEGSSILDRVLSKIFLLERIADIPTVVEEARERLVLLLCHESLARKLWGGHMVYFDPTKNTIQGWSSNPIVRRALLMRQDIFLRHTDSFSRVNVEWLEDMTDDSRGDDPVLEDLIRERGHVDVSVFDRASIGALAVAIERMVANFGVQDTRKAFQSVLRYRARSAKAVFERKSLLTQAVAILMAMQPAVASCIVQERIRGRLQDAALVAKAILLEDPEDISDAARKWAESVGELYEQWCDAFSMGGKFDLSSVPIRDGKRLIKSYQVNAIRSMAGQILSDYLDSFCGIDKVKYTDRDGATHGKSGLHSVDRDLVEYIRDLRSVKKSVGEDRAVLVICEQDFGPSIRAISVKEAEIFFERYPDRIVGVYRPSTRIRELESIIRCDLEAIGWRIGG